jgi:ABC-type branched-subunit amino acid transport system substrate-binding protein
LLIAACAHVPAARKEPPAPPGYVEGLAAFRAGDFATARDDFRSFLAAAPPGAQADAARFYLASSLAELLDCDGARAETARLPPALATNVPACVTDPVVLLDAGKLAEALALAGRVAIDDAQRARLETAIDLAPPAQLDQAAALVGPLGDRVRVRLAAVANLRQVDPARVAVLLPLSGKFASVGKELRAAIELAASEDADARFVYLDTAGDEGKAAAAVDAEAASGHALFFLGPVGEKESRAAASRARSLGFPIAVLSPVDAIGDAPGAIVRLVTSPEARAAGAVRALVAAGVAQPAVLSPKDELGHAQADAFASAAAAAKIPVVARGEFDPSGKSLEDDVRAFLGLDPKTNDRLRRWLGAHPKDGWKTFSPDVPFDAVYVPAGVEQGALIASFLAYDNVELRSTDAVDSDALMRKHGGRLPTLVQLEGPAAWHTPSLVVRGGPAVEGALVVDDWAGADAEPGSAAATFADRFQARTGHAPGASAAQAYDAARMALGVRHHAALDKDPRDAAAVFLRRAELPDGACGHARVDEKGELERDPVVLRVDGGVLEPLR